MHLKQSFFLFVAFICSISGTVYAREIPTAQKPLVVLITIDGFPARALKDPRLPMPTLRMLAEHGAVATAMHPINPTVTWPNHTALITGVDARDHDVMANGLITFPADGGAPQIKPWVDKDRLVHAQTLYEAAAKKGLTTGQVDWVAIYGAHGVRWQFGERPDVHGIIAQDLIARGIVTSEQVEQFGKGSSSAWRDQIWTDAAVDILEKHTPSLLLFHLLQTDSIQHQYGPLTPAAYEAYANADHCLERIVNAVRSIGALDRTTFILASDHGFATYTHILRPNVALVEMGLLQKSGEGYVGRVWAKAEGGAASIYIRDASRRAELIPKLKDYFEHLSGVSHVYSNDEARSIGIPSDTVTDQAPQLYMTATEGYAFADGTNGPLSSSEEPRGQHGYLNSMPDMQALFIASGAAIRPGLQLGPISNLRVAPTIAKILGVQLPDAKQPPLDEILRQK